MCGRNARSASISTLVERLALRAVAPPKGRREEDVCKNGRLTSKAEPSAMRGRNARSASISTRHEAAFGMVERLALRAVAPPKGRREEDVCKNGRLTSKAEPSVMCGRN